MPYTVNDAAWNTFKVTTGAEGLADVEVFPHESQYALTGDLHHLFSDLQ